MPVIYFLIAFFVTRKVMEVTEGYDAEDAVVKERRKICKGCLYNVDGMCEGCGCPIKEKTEKLFQFCPKGKWNSQA